MRFGQGSLAKAVKSGDKELISKMEKLGSELGRRARSKDDDADIAKMYLNNRAGKGVDKYGVKKKHLRSK
jgi:hypothetical protein